MNLKKLLNEVEAEIVRDGSKTIIPRNKIFSNGNIADISKDDVTKDVLIEILRKIKEMGIENDFGKDQDPVDIWPGKAIGLWNVRSDSGKSYIYNVNKKTLVPAQ